ncbi:hypothetical protein KC866_01450 [Patescibacteria group bacterium]|nr:hypothetical protein [Patescibacteria group bacterium]
MDQDFQKILEENNALLKEQGELIRENQEKITKIQLYIRRTMIGKWLYWIFIIAITVSAFYVSKPYIKSAVNTYNDVKDNVDASRSIISDPGSLFKDVNLIERLFGTNSDS